MMKDETIVVERDVHWLPEAVRAMQQAVEPMAELHAGDLCPGCGRGRLDYDGLLNLSCSRCGYTLGGCFT